MLKEKFQVQWSVKKVMLTVFLNMKSQMIFMKKMQLEKVLTANSLGNIHFS